MSAFRLIALTPERFAAWWGMDEAALRQRGASRVTVDAQPGYPCRVSLTDAPVGEHVLAVSFEHQSAASPYRGAGPIFVRPGVPQAQPQPGEVPDAIRRRLLSVRAYDDRDWMIEAEVCEGRDLEAQIRRCFAEPRVRYLHLHNARPGCYSCRVDRAQAGSRPGPSLAL